MDDKEFWQKIESFLKGYELSYAPVRWFGGWGGLTCGREGYFVLFRFIFLIALYPAAFYLPPYFWLKIPMTILACYLIADMFLMPTSLAFWGNSGHEAVARFGFCLYNIYLDIDSFWGVIFNALPVFF